MLWPAPLPLEGVKSRKRAIFELKEGAVQVDGEQCNVSSVSLTLASRVAAIGKEGRSLVEVLLGSLEPVDGAVTKHEKLSVVHIGQHLETAAAAAAALEVGPQVVVLSEPSDPKHAWAETFSLILNSEGIRAFQGAVVVCVAREADIPHDLCLARWIATGGRVRAEEIRPGLDIVDDVCGKAISEPDWNTVLKQASSLALQSFDDSADDGDQAIATLAEQQGWTVATMTITDGSVEGGRDLVGYVTYNAEPALDGLYLARVAVEPKFRRRGHGSRLVRWLIGRARLEGYSSVWVHAVPDLQPINAALGFKYVSSGDAAACGDDRKSAWMVLKDAEAVQPAPAHVQKKSKKERRKARR